MNIIAIAMRLTEATMGAAVRIPKMGINNGSETSPNPNPATVCTITANRKIPAITN
jgi:hypothetical protein